MNNEKEKNNIIVDNMIKKVEKFIKDVSAEELTKDNEKKKVVNLILNELEKEIANED